MLSFGETKELAYQAIQIENEHRDDYLKAINYKHDLINFLEESIENSLKLIDL